ncbi:ABC transporter permease [Leptolyngbya sp. FACHB-261]|uniref:ABC transporter permease n=1 Tax=Leptolyngbya sp. FACHB-261 TaxID=2692806 RepID=UPI00168360AA|nr:ABC transporter permease [Leptolyngbya sp. FACHB-261]MBD2104259.1 ABC transporter permease [Leptolyngbya sp. FACHB-261]
MNWWQRLKRNPLARFGLWVLVVLYLLAILAGFAAPYGPNDAQRNGALLPPTQIFWRNQNTGEFLGPHVYPTTQGPVDFETGERKLVVDRSQPSRIVPFAKGTAYKLLGLIPMDRHLFGTQGEGRFNLLGTDEQGRDELSRLLYGSQVSLFIGIVGIAITFPLGMLLGGISGYWGGLADTLIMRLTEVLMSIPTIYLLVALAAVLENNPLTGVPFTNAERFFVITIIISFVSWSGLTRVVRGQVLAIKSEEYVEAAQAMGAGPLYIILRHILPQTATYIIISATLSIPGFILAESVLSLIGLGIQQPDASWGNMLSLATNASIIVLQPWLIWPPAILIILTVLAFNLLGDGLRDALDPRNLQQ